MLPTLHLLLLHEAPSLFLPPHTDGQGTGVDGSPESNDGIVITYYMNLMEPCEMLYSMMHLKGTPFNRAITFQLKVLQRNKRLKSANHATVVKSYST